MVSERDVDECVIVFEDGTTHSETTGGSGGEVTVKSTSGEVAAKVIDVKCNSAAWAWLRTIKSEATIAGARH